ncbi:ArsR/SmtB family transcription factor [Caldisericum exile]|uniref:ArsR family transcriptional regulator n=1 Tax=Caldisericum exile (strain DSM 21853 / NBRC 104410 / AZM16c01) TaxID=511051 RepID=A0A7U6GFL8_CALEA|nr:metalloregulator ArsR/SmtB family transcription factor [Caldisericum exile]BAL81523.1 ArsR family transcriptional regulator [Caldisericum exile AZM16c01]
MVEKIDIEKLSRFFKGLLDPTRLKMIILLMDKGEMCVNKIVKALNIRELAVSQQLQILIDSGIARKRKEGQFVRYFISNDFIRKLIESTEEYLTGGN